MPYQPDTRRAYATAALTGVAPFQGAAEDTARRVNAPPAGIPVRQPGESLEQLFARGTPIRPAGPLPPPQPAPPPTPLPRGLPPISPADAAKVLAQMNAPRPTYGAGSFGAILQQNDPVIGAGINIADSPEVQLAKMQLSAQRAGGEAAAANAADQNGLHAQALGQQQQAEYAQNQLARQNLGLEQQRLGLSQSQLQQAAQQFNQQQALSREQMQSHEKIAGMPYSPEALRAAGNAAIINALAQNAGKPGGQPIEDTIGQIRGLMPPPAGAAAAAPGTAPAPQAQAAAPAVPGADPAADAARKVLAPLFQATPDKRLLAETPTGIDQALRLISAAQTPQARQAMVAQLGQKSPAALAGLQDAAARQLAANLLQARKVGEYTGRGFPASHAQPVAGLDKPFELFEQVPEGYLGQLGHRFSAGMASGTPYNKIRLPNGRVIDFDAGSALPTLGSAFTDTGEQIKQANQRLQTLAPLLQSLYAGAGR